MVIQQIEREKSVSEALKKGMNGLNDRSVREKENVRGRTKLNKGDDERQAATTTN